MKSTYSVGATKLNSLIMSRMGSSGSGTAVFLCWMERFCWNLLPKSTCHIILLMWDFYKKVRVECMSPVKKSQVVLLFHLTWFCASWLYQLGSENVARLPNYNFANASNKKCSKYVWVSMRGKESAYVWGQRSVLYSLQNKCVCCLMCQCTTWSHSSYNHYFYNNNGSNE